MLQNQINFKESFLILKSTGTRHFVQIMTLNLLKTLICLPFWTLLSLKVIIMFFPILAQIYTYVNINPNLLSIDCC